MTETTPLTVEDILEEAPQFHTILEVWREVLKPALEQSKVAISPQYALRITSTYREVDFADMGNYRDLYFDHILELEGIVVAEIDGDEECLKYTSAEEDVQFNSHHYFNILLDWQKAILSWELEWDYAHQDAGCQLAALSEVHKMFFGENGLTALLDQIQFQFTEDDQALLTAELQAMREAWEER